MSGICLRESRLSCNCEYMKIIFDRRIPIIINQILRLVMLTEENIDAINEKLLVCLKREFVSSYVVYEANIEIQDGIIQLEKFPIKSHQSNHLHEIIYYEGRLVIQYYKEQEFRIQKRMKVIISATDNEFARKNNRFLEE